MRANIDIHNHFLPRGLFQTASHGRDWYGAHLEQNNGRTRIVLNGMLLPHHTEECLRLLNVSEHPEERIQKAKKRQLDFQVLGIAAWFANHHLDAPSGSAFCREVNEELAELQAHYPADFMGIAMLPWQDTKAALNELEYATKDLKLRVVYIASHVNGNNLDDPGLFPVIEAIASEGLFLICYPYHPLPDKEKRLSRYEFSTGIAAPMEVTLAAMSLIFGGVLDRCPSLKVCFYNGGGFALYDIKRMTFAYHNKAEARTMKRPPEEYLPQFYFDSQVYHADILQFLMNHVSADHILLGTDFPLTWYMNETVPWIQHMPFLSDEEKEKILGLNAARILSIDTHS